MAADLAKTLDRARGQLEKNKDETALTTLLAAWRAKRSPRIADVIDRISDRVASARGGPITAKTVVERTKKWLAVAKKKHPSSVGQLLATPWPGTWNDALPVLEALVKIPSDPRIAMALAQLVDATPFDTYRSHWFYRPLLAHVLKVLDARTLPVLEADLEREKSHWWSRSTRPYVEVTVKKLKAAYENGPPKLSTTEEASLAALEALFASSVVAEKARAKGESDFLKAIYESPDDDALRAVFADWLTEKGDPRGEFISLQLAHQATGAAHDDHEIEIAKREASLLKKHGKVWAGALDRLILKEHRRFERGFLASAILDLEGSPQTPPKAMSDPAWATVHTLEVTWNVNYQDGLAAAIFSLPSLRWLRRIRGVQESTVISLFTQESPPRPRIEEIDFEADSDTKPEDREIIAAGSKVFPNLKCLTIESEVDGFLEALIGGALGRRLERITLANYDHPLGPLCRMVERLGLPAKEVCLVGSNRRNGSPWLMTARRDDRNRFTRIHGEPYEPLPGACTPSASALQEMLEMLTPEDLTELTVDRTWPCKYDEGDIQRLEARLALFTNATNAIDVPWERLAPKPKTNELPIKLSIAGSGDNKVGSKENLPKLWKLVSEPPLSLSFDSYAVNYGAHTLLPSDGLVHAVALLEKKRTSTLRLYRKGSSDAYALDLRDTYVEIASPFRPDALDDYIAWLARLHDEIKININMTTAPFMRRDEESGEWEEDNDQPTLEPLQGIMFHWIMVLGPEYAKMLAFDEMEKLARSPGLEWLRIVPTKTKRNLICVAGPRIDQIPTDEQRTAFQVLIAKVLWNGCARVRGFVPIDLTLEMLGPPLAKHGFAPVELPPLRRAQGEVFFVARHPAGVRGLRVETLCPMDDMELRFTAFHARDKPDADVTLVDDNNGDESRRDWWIEDCHAKTEKQARAGLKKVVAQLEKTILPWFGMTPEEEAAARKKRGRR